MTDKGLTHLTSVETPLGGFAQEGEHEGEKGWAAKELREVEREIKNWPAWMRSAARANVS